MRRSSLTLVVLALVALSPRAGSPAPRSLTASSDGHETGTFAGGRRGVGGSDRPFSTPAPGESNVLFRSAGDVLVLYDAIFEPGTAKLSEAARKRLRALGRSYRDADVARVAVTVYVTDAAAFDASGPGDADGRDGSGEAGKPLATARVAAVAKALVSGGFPAVRLDLSVAPATLGSEAAVRIDSGAALPLDTGAD
jgi:hypothetical protein